MADEALLEYTALIVANHVTQNPVGPSELPGPIRSVHAALNGLGVSPPVPEPELKPAVPIRSSVKPDYVVCLEDGKKMKMLKRHSRWIMG